MLRRIADDGGNVKKYVDMAKDKSSNFRLMGFGHRVYKNYDPRAKIIKSACDTLLQKLNLKDPLFDVAQELEEVALRDPYFIERKLYPNVDFYSGVIYRAMGLPVQMFTVLLARLDCSLGGNASLPNLADWSPSTSLHRADYSRRDSCRKAIDG
jgi:citrate synthase